MKKVLFAVVAVGILFVSGCGNSWELTKKNLKSNYVGGIEREYKIYTIDGKLLQTITGTSYWEHSNGTVIMEITIYNVKTDKKFEIVGNFIITAEEK